MKKIPVTLCADENDSFWHELAKIYRRQDGSVNKIAIFLSILALILIFLLGGLVITGLKGLVGQKDPAGLSREDVELLIEERLAMEPTVIADEPVALALPEIDDSSDNRTAVPTDLSPIYKLVDEVGNAGKSYTDSRIDEIASLAKNTSSNTTTYIENPADISKSDLDNSVNTLNTDISNLSSETSEGMEDLSSRVKQLEMQTSDPGDDSYKLQYGYFNGMAGYYIDGQFKPF